MHEKDTGEHFEVLIRKAEHIYILHIRICHLCYKESLCKMYLYIIKI